MDYLYKITVEIDDEKVLSLQQHDLDAVYKTEEKRLQGVILKKCRQIISGLLLLSGTVAILSAKSELWRMRFTTAGSASI